MSVQDRNEMTELNIIQSPNHFPSASVSSDEEPREMWSSLVNMDTEQVVKIPHNKDLKDPRTQEICGKYIAQSNSEILNHPYYIYPSLIDPGISHALLKPPDAFVYPDDGEELYLAVCKEMNTYPVSLFHQGLTQKVIDLSYYGVNGIGVAAMAKALSYNRLVKTLNLMDNFLSSDACFHLGEMLITNVSLEELDLTGCRIGPEGLRNLIQGLKLNRKLKILNLQKNQLGDKGGEIMNSGFMAGVNLEAINLSFNDLGKETLTSLISGVDYIYTSLRKLDLSWNNLFAPPKSFYKFMIVLSEILSIEEINLSWNGISGEQIGLGLGQLLKARNLKYLYLSHNQIRNEVEHIADNLNIAKKLITLDLSFNPLSQNDALLLVEKMTLRSVRLRELLLENVDVSQKFMETRSLVMTKKKNKVITHGIVRRPFLAVGPDMRDVILNRLDYLLQRPKKKLDIAIIAQTYLENKVFSIVATEFFEDLKAMGASVEVDEKLIKGLADVFPCSKKSKFVLIDMEVLVEYARRKWPHRQLPPPPPPELDPQESDIEQKQNSELVK